MKTGQDSDGKSVLKTIIERVKGDSEFAKKVFESINRIAALVDPQANSKENFVENHFSMLYLLEIVNQLEYDFKKDNREDKDTQGPLTIK